MIRSSGNVKMAIEAIRSARWRSLLTMLGIVIGVVSVVTTVSLGEGVKRQIVGQINRSGSDIITIRPGNVSRDAQGHISSSSLLNSLQFGSFSKSDLDTVSNLPQLKEVVPFAYVTNVVSADDQVYSDGVVIGTNGDLPSVLNQKIEYGTFFSDDNNSLNKAVVGKRVAEKLFGENVPLGRTFEIRGQEFAVVGVFEEFQTSPLTPQNDYNTAIFIPYQVTGEVSEGAAKLYQIVARAAEPTELQKSIDGVTTALSKKHANQHDFAVLTQQDSLQVTNNTLNLMTGFISSIAAISLLVGGIGILNIMLVSVTERTHEIGVRKAIGATNRQILGQFLTESAILSLLGGLIGVICSFLANYLFRILTDLQPVLTWQIIVIAVGVAVSVGIIFGITPALKAARKHPIAALRHE